MSDPLKEEIARLEKQYGPGVVMGAHTVTKTVEVLPTGIISVDLALGIGGFPRGRISEISGLESSGKTSLMWALIGQLHKSDPEAQAYYCDMEHAADLEWAEKFGVDKNRLKISQSGSLEEALDVTEGMVRSGAFKVAVVDSIAALVPLKELQGTMEDNTVGLVPRLMGKHLRKIGPAADATGTGLIYINQIRQNIGVLYGNPNTTPGGMAIRFSASIRCEVKKVESIKDGKEDVGTHHRVTVKKNKLASPYRVAEFDLYFNEGISKIGALVDVALDLGIITKGGAWMKWNDQQLQGKDKVKEYFRDNEEAFIQLAKEVYERINQ